AEGKRRNQRYCWGKSHILGSSVSNSNPQQLIPANTCEFGIWTASAQMTHLAGLGLWRRVAGGGKPSLKTRLLSRWPVSRYDFRSPRLYIDRPLAAGGAVALDSKQAHYLGRVLRRKPGDAVLVFNGRDGEWRASYSSGGK